MARITRRSLISRSGRGAGESAVMTQDRPQRRDSDHHPCRHAGKGGAGQVQPQPEDQDRVEHGIHHAAEDGGEHRASRVSMGAQDGPADHPYHQQWQRRHDDRQVMHRKPRRFPLGAQQPHQPGQIDPDQGREPRAEQHPPDQAVGSFFAGLLDRPCPQGPCAQCPRGDRHADPERSGKEQDRPGISHRRGKLGFAQHRNEEHVDEIDRKYRDQPDGPGQGHHADMREQVSRQKLGLFIGHFGRLRLIGAGSPLRRIPATAISAGPTLRQRRATRVSRGPGSPAEAAAPGSCRARGFARSAPCAAA